MPSPSDKAVPRCLLCSMHCPIGASVDALGHLHTVFGPELGRDQGACVRALTAARLVDVPERIFAARSGGQATSADAALRSLVSVAGDRGADGLAVMLDVNRPLEGVLAVAALCREAGVRLCACAPLEDLPLVRAGLTAGAPFEQIAECDFVLAVGDPFSSHPAVARPVRDMQFGERGNRLVCVDSAWGRTCRGANQAITVSPFKMAGFMSALATACGAESVGAALGVKSVEEICGMLDVPAASVASLAAGLKGAKSPGIVLSHSLGRYANGAAVAAAVKELAAAIGAKVWPLLVSTNSAVLPALKATFGSVELAELIRDVEGGRIRSLFVIGLDPLSMLPAKLWQTLSEGAELLGWAGSLESDVCGQARHVLPLAFPWEEGGTVLGPTGKPAESPAWLAAPPTVLTLKDLVGKAVSYAGVASAPAPGVDALLERAPDAAPTEELIGPEILEASEAGEGEALLVGASEPQGYTGGLSLASSNWQRRLAAEEAAVLSLELAAELGITGRGAVALTNGAETTVPCRTADGGEGRLVALPAHWDVLRELLQWRGADGAVEPAPALVDIRKAE